MCDDDFLYDTSKLEHSVDRSRLKLSRQRNKNMPQWARDGAGGAAFSIPLPVKMDYRWVKAGESIIIGSYTIQAGLFYFGSSMQLLDGSTECSLVNPQLPFSRTCGDQVSAAEPLRILDYSVLSPSQRSEYLAWLAGGRNAGEVSGWVIKLFLMGLERRVFEDARRGVVSTEEIREIHAEADRLLDCCKTRQDSAVRALSLFYQFLALQRECHALYAQHLPLCIKHERFSYYIRLMLQQLAVDNIPVTGAVLFMLYAYDTQFRKSHQFNTCFNEYQALFIYYADKIITRQKTDCSKKNSADVITGSASLLTLADKSITMKAVYTPLSESVRTVATKPKKITLVLPGKELKHFMKHTADYCNRSLARYANHLCGSETLTKYRLQWAKPFLFWEEAAKQAVFNLKKQLNTENRFMYGEAGWLLRQINVHQADEQRGEDTAYSPDIFADITGAFEEIGLSIAPDTRMHPRTLSRYDKIVVFRFEGDADDHESSRVKVLLNILNLTAAAFHKALPESRSPVFPRWITDMPDYHAMKLRCSFIAAGFSPPSLREAVGSLKKYRSIEIDRMAAKYVVDYFRLCKEEYLIDFCSKDIMVLEEIYRSFKLDTQWLYTHLHKNAAGEKFDSADQDTGLILDKGKIKQLHKDTAHIFEVLARIFAENTEDDEPEPAPPPPAASRENPLLPGMDAACTALLRRFLTQELWDAANAHAAAKEYGLPLYGAIETINEKSFDLYNEPLIEDNDNGGFRVNQRLSGDILKQALRSP